MPLVDDLRALAIRSSADLDAVHNFFDHTNHVWRTFRIWVQQGNTLEAANLETGSKVNAQDLLKLSDQYKNEYLLTFTFQHYVALFENFIFDFFRLFLVDDPRRLAPKKQVDVRSLLSATDRASMIHIIAEHELNELK